MGSLEGRVVLVTGVSGNLGHVLAGRLAAAGAVVAGLDLAARDASAARLVLTGVDLTDAAATGEAIARIKAELGRLDGVCNIAGGFVWTTLADGGAAAWERMFRLNVLTAATVCAAAARVMEEGGSIVNVGAAAAADRSAMGMGAYTGSKAAVAKLTESLAAELKSSRIRVNAVLPTIIDTALNRADMPDADPADWVTPDALADVVAFLLSGAARAVTGALLPVRGRVL
jgi:NAD(P)-dependent dehydrogenase (short-subunit alcohol dehydrogenase family)